MPLFKATVVAENKQQAARLLLHRLIDDPNQAIENVEEVDTKLEKFVTGLKALIDKYYS